jgi:hypothetical protein
VAVDSLANVQITYLHSQSFEARVTDRGVPTEVRATQHEIRTGQPLVSTGEKGLRRSTATGAAAVGAAAFGALALGAAAIGALAIGRLAVGALAIRRGRVQSLAVETLDVRRLHVRELVIDGGAPR